jgi:hypothetical protein
MYLLIYFSNFVVAHLYTGRYEVLYQFVLVVATRNDKLHVTFDVEEW